MGPLSGSGSSSSSKIAHGFRTRGLLVLLILRGLEDEPAVSFKTDIWATVSTGPFPLGGLCMRPLSYPPLDFLMPITVSLLIKIVLPKCVTWTLFDGAVLFGAFLLSPP